MAIIDDPLPAYREGLATALRAAGWDVVEDEHWIDWLQDHDDVAAVITVEEPSDLVQVAAARQANTAATLCVLMANPSTEMTRSSLAAGAAAVLARASPATDVVTDLRAAHARGRTVLPTGVARTLAERAVHQPLDAPRVSSEQIKWLHALAGGATVAMLAHRASYSERQMSRLLQELYMKLGVRTREAALVQAALWGLLVPPSDQQSS